MATNPMQKKARNSFILGVLITVVIMGLVVALLLMQLMKMKDEEAERLEKLVSVYALNTDVKSGDTITMAKLTRVETDSGAVPKNALSSISEDTVAKIDLNAGTVVTSSMVTSSTENVTNDLRLQEYNMIRLASQIASDDYIDIRLRTPNGLDYIVVSKKKVEIPVIEGVESLNTIWIKLTEDETLTMSNAIVEAYKMEGSFLYTAKYVEPGMQDKATPTFVPSAETVNLITQNPNVIAEAKTAMYNRYNTNTSIRNNINSEISRTDENEARSRVNSGAEQEVSTAQEQRQSYLDSLSGY